MTALGNVLNMSLNTRRPEYLIWTYSRFMLEYRDALLIARNGAIISNNRLLTKI